MKQDIGYNGCPIVFNTKRKIDSAEALDKKVETYKELSKALEQMGIKVSTVKIKESVKILFPDSWQNLDVNGEVLRKLFKHLNGKV